MAVKFERTAPMMRLKEKGAIYIAPFVNRIGFEPMATCLEGRSSIQLSYRSNFPQTPMSNKSLYLTFRLGVQIYVKFPQLFKFSAIQKFGAPWT